MTRRAAPHADRAARPPSDINAPRAARRAMAERVALVPPTETPGAGAALLAARLRDAIVCGRLWFWCCMCPVVFTPEELALVDAALADSAQRLMLTRNSMRDADTPQAYADARRAHIAASVEAETLAQDRAVFAKALRLHEALHARS